MTEERDPTDLGLPWIPGDVDAADDGPDPIEDLLAPEPKFRQATKRQRGTHLRDAARQYGRQSRRSELLRRCGHCSATPGAWCSAGKRGERMGFVHPSR